MIPQEDERRIAGLSRLKKWIRENPDQVRATKTAWKAAHIDQEKLRQAAWHIAHKEQVKARHAIWYINHKEQEKNRHAILHLTNKTRENLRSKAWSIKNKDRLKKLNSAWKRSHLGKLRVYEQNRCSREKNNGGQLSPGLAEKLLAFQKSRCALCRTSLKKAGYHMDHVVPLAKGGKNIDGNIQLTCPKCNLEKNSKDPIEFMQSRGYLL